jgi:urease accessory protein
MLSFEQRYTGSDTATEILCLPFEDRQRSRMVGKLANGSEFSLKLPRGSTLRDGDLLLATCGTVVRVEAAPEALCRVEGLTETRLARAAYHLGNRHVPTQIETGAVSFQRDTVLTEMLRGLGFHVHEVKAPFEPEPGAYHGHLSESHQNQSSIRSHGHAHD